MTWSRALKRLVILLCMLPVAPMAAVARLGRTFHSHKPYDFFAQTLSMLPGMPGSYVRVAYYKLTLKRIGWDVKIGFGSFFSKDQAEVGNRINIGGYCILGNVDIADGVLIASRVSIISGKYEHGSAFAPETGGACRVRIGAGSWIGEGAIVAADVGANCLVATGAVVSREVPNGYMAAGNPAKMMRTQPFMSVVSPPAKQAAGGRS